MTDSKNYSLENFRLEVFNLYIKLGLVISLPLVGMYSYIGMNIVAAASAAYFLFFIVMFFWAKKFETLDMRAVRLFLISTITLMMTAHYMGNEFIDNKPWPVLIPILAMSLTGPKEGAIWSVFIMFAILVITAITPNDYDGFAILLQQSAIGTTAIVFYHFIKHNEESMRVISELSHIDALTQTYNRRYFNITFDTEIRRSHRNNSQFAVLMIDIDHFKLYNDLYGHLQGDLVLTQIANTLTEKLRRAGDFIYRYGGEEFCILLTDMNHKNALMVANLLRETIYDLNIIHKAADINRVTVSVGLIHSEQYSNSSSHELLNLADKALYNAKEKGRNTIVEAGQS